MVSGRLKDIFLSVAEAKKESELACFVHGYRANKRANRIALLTQLCQTHRDHCGLLPTRT